MTLPDDAVVRRELVVDVPIEDDHESVEIEDHDGEAEEA